MVVVEGEEVAMGYLKLAVVEVGVGVQERESLLKVAEAVEEVEQTAVHLVSLP